MEKSDAFDAIIQLADEKRRAQDMDDLNHERSGAETGRIKRFLGDQNSPDARQARKDRQAREFQSLLDTMMRDQEYAQLWQERMERAREIQNKVDAFLDQVDQKIDTVKGEVEKLRGHAVTLPDGSKAFMDQSGRAWTEHGNSVDPEIAAGIDWSDRPSYEAFQAKQREISRLQELGDQAHLMSGQIGELQNRLEDEEEPLSKEELGEALAEIEAANDRIDELAREVEPIRSNPAAKLSVDSRIEVPTFQ